MSLALAKTYLGAIEAGATGDMLAPFYAPDVVQEEFPNRLTPNGAERDLAALLDGAAKGQKGLLAQRYEILDAFESGATVILEVQWTGILASALGRIPVGGEMRARFAMFLEFRGGLIVHQRNYDCFEPW